MRPPGSAGDGRAGTHPAGTDGRYKWVALANTTAAVFMSALDGSIVIIALPAIGGGMFAAPNSSSIMSSVPARHRGAASGMRSTFQNSGTALSIGAFFSLMIAGLASSLPGTLTGGLERLGVPTGIAHHVGSLPPVSSLFAAVLGVNPLQHLLAASRVLLTLPAASQQTITGRRFFPAVPPRPGGGVHRCRRTVGAGRGRVAVARGPLRRPCGGRASEARGAGRPGQPSATAVR
jgi:hypothetical protein